MTTILLQLPASFASKSGGQFATESHGHFLRNLHIDRRFSFAGIDKQLCENRTLEAAQPVRDTRPLAEQIREIIGQKSEQPSPTYETQAWGLLNALLDGYEPPAAETMDDAERRRRKRKKGRGR